MSHTELHVCFSPETAETVADPTFVIETVLRDVDETEITERFTKFSTLDIDSGTNLPVYDLLWSQIVQPDSSLDGLIDCLLLFEKLRAKIEEAGAAVLVPHEDLKQSHHALLEDVAEGTEVVVADGYSPSRRFLQDLRGQYLRMGLIILDQLLNLVLGLFDRADPETDVVFVPQAGREGSLTPVLAAADFDFGVRVYPLFHLLRPHYDEQHGLDGYGPESLYGAAGPGTILTELRFAWSFARSMRGENRMERELLEYVQAEYGYQMPNTIQACCQRIYRQKLADIFSVPIGRALLESTDCSAVVVGSPTVPCRGLIHAATESDTAAFLVPHGITRPREPLVPAGTTMFLPGNLGETYLEEMFPPERLPRLVVTGRPYLEAQHRHRRESYAPSGEPLRIVIATQQFSDFVRETFLRETLRGLERVAYPVEAVIKTHPSESTGLYEEILEDVDAKDGRRIRIEETGLEDHVKRACLLLTINSNVGLESIVLGTPCVSVNLFKPYVPTYPYARGEAVPELTSRDEIEAFFETLDLEVLKSLQARQEPFLEENYELDGEAADRIVTHIRASLE